MTMDTKTLETLFAQALKAQGFKKKRRNWYRQAKDVLQVVNLQKSDWGPQFWLNLALVPEGMTVEGMPQPPHYKCPIRIRLGSAYPDKRAVIDTLLDLEDVGLSDEQRTEGIEKMFHEMVLPFMDRLQTIDDLKRAIDDGTLRRSALDLVAKKHLGLPLE